MSDNYEWLKDQFGLNKEAGADTESVAAYQEKLAANILFQRAAVEHLEKEAAAAGADLSQLADEDILKLAHERYVNFLENGGQEKTASAPVALSEEQEFFELHKFAGEIQGMAAYTTFQNLMKEAGRGGEMAGKAWEGLKGVAGRVGEKLVGEGSKQRVAGKKLEEAATHFGTTPDKMQKGLQRKLIEGRAAKQTAEEIEAMQKRRGGAALGIAGTGVVGGGVAAEEGIRRSGTDKEASATEQLVQLRMYDMLKEAGYVDNNGNIYEPNGGQQKEAAGFMDAVDQEALARLQNAGYR